MTGRRVTPRRWPPRASRCAAARRFPRAGIAGSGKPKPSWRRPGRGLAQAGRKAAEREAARKGPGPVRNITDPDSRLMPVRGGGFIQGYNTQNVPSEDGLIIATELTVDTDSCQWSEPMTEKAEQAAALIEANRPAASAGPVPAGQDQDGGT